MSGPEIERIAGETGIALEARKLAMTSTDPNPLFPLHFRTWRVTIHTNILT